MQTTTSTLTPMFPMPPAFGLNDVLEPLLDGLNPPQREAVVSTEGPLLILAGAGSGKTRVLTRRIAYLLATKKARRSEILAVTFTNKAAKEMQNRVQELCGGGEGRRGRFPDLGTFHSVCSRWLRSHGSCIGLAKEFAIYATDEQMVVMREVIKEWGKDDKKFTPRTMLSTVSRWKNLMQTPDDAAKAAKNRYEEELVEVYRRYQAKLAKNQAVDFDDLLLKTVEMFRRDPDLLEQYRERIKYVLIDEYQDVNPVQYELVRLLSEPRRNLCVVGDDDQSIYAFRGADVSIMLRFEKDYPEAKLIKLEQNYRSTSPILEASNAVVCHNVGRKNKRLWTDKKGGEKLTYFLGGDGRDEGRFVAKSIRQLLSAGRSPKDCVILYRTNAQSRLLEESMIQAALPYKIIGGLRFFERKEIRDILAYLNILHNVADSISLKRIVNVPARGVGEVTWGKLQESAARQELTTVEFLMQGPVGLGGKVEKALTELGEWLAQLRGAEMALTALVKEILARSGYRKALEDEKSVESVARLENLDELLNVTGEFDKNSEDPSLENFLAEVSLLSDQDTYSEDKDSVTLMTLHAAKGLEFPVVFLAGLEEETFPHSRSIEDPDQMEEERRLCYVGLTRAMEKLFVTSAQSREVQGMRVPRMPSRFLDEIPDALLQREGATFSEAPRGRQSSRQDQAIGSGNWKGFGQSAPRAGAVSSYRGEAAQKRVSGAPRASAPVSLFSPSVRVVHASFGKGEVLKADGDVVTVRFDSGVEKKLKGDFLKLDPAGPGPSSPAPSQPPPSGRVGPGDRLDHPRWGPGLVKSADPSSATVVFSGFTVTLSMTEAVKIRC